VLLDDREARKAAIRRALRVMGTVGVLEQAAIHELIDLPEVCARLLTTNFRIKDYIIHNVLARDAARKAAAHAQSPEPQETQIIATALQLVISAPVYAGLSLSALVLHTGPTR
jgi:hypothetical protein